MFKRRPVRRSQTNTCFISLLNVTVLHDKLFNKGGLNIYTQPRVFELEDLGSHVQEGLAERLTGG